MSNRNDDSIQIVKPFLFLTVFVIAVTLVGFILHSASVSRKKAIRESYTQEANTYIAKNKKGLEVLFESMSMSCEVSCPPLKASIISKTITDDMSNFSSTMFIKAGDGKNIILLRLSGDQSSGSSINTDADMHLWNVSEGKVSEIPVDDYFWDMQGNEVIIPVKNSDGRIIGAIVRGVIE